MFFVVVALLFWGAVKIVSFPTLQIKGVAVEGTKILSKEIITQKVEKELFGNYYWFFPKKNIFLYPKGKMKAILSTSFPAMETVAISVNSSHVLIISIQEREPFALWCGIEKPSIDILEVPACFYIDKTGYIFSNSPSFSGDAYFTLYGSETLNIKKTPLGQYAVTADVFKKVLELRDFLTKSGIVADTIYFGENKYAEFIDTKSFAVRWNTDANIDTLTGNMRALFNSPSWKNNTFVSDAEKASEPLEYLDFRFGNKIFYKQKGEELAVPAVPSIPIEISTSTPSEMPTT